MKITNHIPISKRKVGKEVAGRGSQEPHFNLSTQLDYTMKQNKEMM